MEKVTGEQAEQALNVLRRFVVCSILEGDFKIISADRFAATISMSELGIRITMWLANGTAYCKPHVMDYDSNRHLIVNTLNTSSEINKKLHLAIMKKLKSYDAQVYDTLLKKLYK